MMIWTVMALVFLMAVMALLSHLAGGVSWSSLFSISAKAAEPDPSPGMEKVLHPAIADPLLLAYQSWKRFTRLPYRSPNHRERFVNHYANDVAGAYKNMKRWANFRSD